MYNFRVGNGGHAQLEQICLPLSNVCFRQPPALTMNSPRTQTQGKWCWK